MLRQAILLWAACILPLVVPVQALAASLTAPQEGTVRWTQMFHRAELSEKLVEIVYANGQWFGLGEREGLISSADGETWHKRVIPAAFRRITGIAYGAGRFVAVDAAGEIHTSTDGIEWNLVPRRLHKGGQQITQEDELRSVAFHNGLFVIGGTRLDNRTYFPTGDLFTLISADGLTWTEHQMSTTKANYIDNQMIAADNGWYAYVVHGMPILSQVAYSPDAKQWTKLADLPMMLAANMAYGNGLLLLPNGFDAHVSTDGTRWTRAGSINGRHTTFADGRFIVFGNGIATSTDGKEWTATGQDHIFTAGDYHQGKYVAVDKENRLWSSRDGRTWTEGRVVPSSTNPPAAVYSTIRADRTTVPADGRSMANITVTLKDADGLPLAGAVVGLRVSLDYVPGAGNPMADVISPDRLLGVTGVTNEQGIATFSMAFETPRRLNLQASADGGQVISPNSVTVDFVSTTSAVPLQRMSPLTALSYGNGFFLAGDQNGGVLAFTDPNQIKRYQPAGVSISFEFLTQWKGDWVALANGGRLFYSTSGSTWQEAAGPAAAGLRAFAAGKDRLVAVGLRGTVLTSEDGRTWTAAQASTSVDLVAVAYGGGNFVAIGPKGTVITSADGKTWSAQSLGRYALTGLTYGGGEWLAVADGAVFASPDGHKWAKTADVQGKPFTQVAYGAGAYAAITATGQVLTSQNKTDWTEAVRPGRPLNAIVYGENGFVAVGDRMGRPRVVMPLGDKWYDFSSDRDIQPAQAGSTPKSDFGCGRRFTDVPANHPACASVEGLNAIGVIAGYPDGTFLPNRTVTRAELAKLLVLAMNKQPLPGEPLSFSDVQGHWSATQGHLQAAVRLGAFNGYEDGTLRPNLPVTRAQMIKLVAAARGLLPAGVGPYTDMGGKWYEGWVAVAHSAKLIGSGGTTPLWTETVLDGERGATRAEAAILLANLRSQLE